jgi:hypothetical protein
VLAKLRKFKKWHLFSLKMTTKDHFEWKSLSFREFAQFSKQSFLRLKSKHFSQFFWWELNLRGLRGFILQKVQAYVVEKQKIKFCYPSLNIGKEDTNVRIVSVWDRSRDSTPRIFFLEHKMRPLDLTMPHLFDLYHSCIHRKLENFA